MADALSLVPDTHDTLWVRVSVRPRVGRGMGASSDILLQVADRAELDAWIATFKGRVDGIEWSPRLHTCSKCGKVEPWGPAWTWYGSYKQIEDGRPVRKHCSAVCGSRVEEAEDA